MKKLTAIAMLAAVLAASSASGAETKPAGKNDKQASEEEVETQLKAARERLEQAAREVAELSSELAVPVMDRLMIMGQAPPRAMIGVQLDPESGKEGARVVEVSPGGAAEEAGIKAGDIIVALNGEKISGEKSAREVTKRMRDVEPKSKIKVRVLRDGQSKDFEVTARQGGFAFFTRGMPAVPAMPVPPPPPGFDAGRAGQTWAFRLDDEVAGMELVTLTPALGKYFGTDKGVLIVRAPDRASFKLEDGDVILAIGGREPKSGSHATRIIRSYQPGEKIDLKLMRQRKTINLEVTVPEAEKGTMHFNQMWDSRRDEDEDIIFERTAPQTRRLDERT